MVRNISYVNISNVRNIKRFNRIEVCSKVSVEYAGSKPFTFLGAAVLSGLGAVTGARRGGVLGAIAYSVVYAMAGTIIGYVIDAILEAIMRLTYQGLEVAMNYGDQG
jgi:outer membrane lipoprotein SlyB